MRGDAEARDGGARAVAAPRGRRAASPLPAAARPRRRARAHGEAGPGRGAACPCRRGASVPGAGGRRRVAACGKREGGWGAVPAAPLRLLPLPCGTGSGTESRAALRRYGPRARAAPGKRARGFCRLSRCRRQRGSRECCRPVPEPELGRRAALFAQRRAPPPGRALSSAPGRAAAAGLRGHRRRSGSLKRLRHPAEGKWRCIIAFCSPGAAVSPAASAARGGSCACWGVSVAQDGAALKLRVPSREGRSAPGLGRVLPLPAAWPLLAFVRGPVWGAR